METDVSAALTYELKKELADRYFGFRRLIEQEKKDLAEQAKKTTLTVEQKICHDLIRIYSMLAKRPLIDRFFDLTGLDENIFYDEYAIQSPTIAKRLFADQKPKGLTRSGRFKYLLFSCYDNLSRHINLYREEIANLLVEHETIIEEIDLFYQKTDLSHIMGFLRNLDQSHCFDSGLAHSASGLVDPSHFEEKMRLRPPHPVHTDFLTIQPIPPLTAIKRPLKKLAEAAFRDAEKIL